MTEPSQPPAPRQSRPWIRPVLTVAVGVAMVPIAFYAAVLFAFGLTPTCTTTDPPGPRALIVALFGCLVVATAVPLVVAGRRWRVLGGVLGVLAAVPPGWGLVLTLTTPQTGFCF